MDKIQTDLEIYDEMQREEFNKQQTNQIETKDTQLNTENTQINIETTQINAENAQKSVIITQIPSDNMVLDAVDNEFNNLIKIEDTDEAKKIKEFISLFIKKKRDYKFTVQPTYNTLFELTANFCTQVVPILKYLIIRFGEQKLPIYQNRMIKILQSVETEKITDYYNKLNGSFYAKTILYSKLHMLLQENEKKIHMIILLIYALLPFKDKPIKPGTVGVSEQEFEDMYQER